MKQKRGILIIIGLILALVSESIVLYNLYIQSNQGNDKTSTSNPITNNNPISSPTSSPISSTLLDYNIYKNSDWGFSFIYSKNDDFKIWNPTPSMYYSSSFVIQTDIKCMYQCPDVSIAIFKKMPNQSLSEWIAERRKDINQSTIATPSFNVIGDIYPIKVSNSDAYFFKQDTEVIGINRMVLINMDDTKILAISYAFDIDVVRNEFIQIVSSIKLGSPEDFNLDQSLKAKLEALFLK